MLSNGEAIIAIMIMSAVIVLCRAAPFLFFRGRFGQNRDRFIAFVERAVPPIAMTVLAAVSVVGGFKADPPNALPLGFAAIIAVALHLWKRNALLSIVVSTLGYMLFLRIFMLI